MAGNSTITTGHIRGLLAKSLEKAVAGDLSAEDGKNLIGLANQISHSMAVEIKHKQLQLALGQKSSAFGKTTIS